LSKGLGVWAPYASPPHCLRHWVREYLKNYVKQRYVLTYISYVIYFFLNLTCSTLSYAYPRRALLCRVSSWRLQKLINIMVVVNRQTYHPAPQKNNNINKVVNYPACSKQNDIRRTAWILKVRLADLYLYLYLLPPRLTNTLHIYLGQTLQQKT